MQYLWKHRLWPQERLRTTDGRAVRIIDPGLHNTNSGPDFFNAKISIGGHLWAGDVEIHVKASDWHRHHHDGDAAYDSVILHVVDKDDADISRSNGEIIPQLLMPCSPEFSRRYDELVSRADTSLPCASQIPSIPAVHITAWLSALGFERLYDKEERILSLLQRLNGDWQTACYATIARSLGFSINGDPFERLALSLPLNVIGKHSNSQLAVEALLFGQSGLLDDAPDDDPYASKLRQEYAFMAHKFGLKRPESLGWKMARMRPPMFPQRRIALLAAMLNGGFQLMSRVLDVKTVDDARQLFDVRLSEYWHTRYNFGASSPRCISPLSFSSINLLTINAVVPLLYAYGHTHDDTALMDRAVGILQQLPAEKNSVVEPFVRSGIKAGDAFASQALIQLRRQYCEKRKCLFCRIGHRLLAAMAPRG